MKAAATYQGIEGRLRDLVEEALAGSPMYLVDLAVRGQRGSRVVEVFVESDGGLSVEELARLSREVGFLLDTEEVIEGAYRLNVSSPGADRPLASPRQFKKHLGRSVEVRVQPPEEGQKAKTLQGELAAADEEGIELRLANKEARRIPHAHIARAKVLLPW